jgi:DNA-binding transcriptional ArsR family regulator
MILAGSHVGLMEELVAADAPLFGRADAHLRLQPFSWREAGLLVGGDDPATWLEAWCSVGGMPRYLALWDARHDAITNLADLLDGPGAPLGDEGTVVQQELTPGSAAARVLELIALGSHSFSAVRERAGLAPATTSEALTTLESLGFVDRLTPVGEDPRRTKRVRYQVRDPLLRLWLSLVQPHRDAFELERGAAVLAANREQLAASQGRAFEAAARDWLGGRTGTAAGPWWPTGPDGWDEGVHGLALRGTTPAAAVCARWATGVDAGAERARLRTVLGPSPYGVPDELLVVGRSGAGVVGPADLLDT